jgi:hypothetical protein
MGTVEFLQVRLFSTRLLDINFDIIIQPRLERCNGNSVAKVGIKVVIEQLNVDVVKHTETQLAGFITCGPFVDVKATCTVCISG